MRTEIKDSYVLVAGFAQLPKGTPVFETQKVIGCMLIIDTETDIIVDSSFTFIKDFTNDFIAALIQGQSLKSGIDPIIQIIEKRFIVPPQKAVIQALIAAYNRYLETSQPLMNS